MILRLTFICLFLFQTVWSETQPFQIIEDQAKIPSLNPEFKDRKTLKITLQNELQAYLISDPLANQSGAVLSVLTGSWADPKELPGLAHFLEHMLFLGTKKYPVESQFDRYLSEHGGMINAFTSTDFTSYLFSVNNEGFAEALDRFANFFISPLFNPSGVGRELNAIDQEFALNFNSEPRREVQVFKELANPDHPFRNFDIGNTSTLSKATQENLRKWFEENYSANLMRLVVYSPLPIDTLKELVVSDFSPIVNRKLTPPQFDIPLLREDLNGNMIYIQPNQNIRHLSLIWELPPQFAKMKETKPQDIICYILGHEGEESLLAELKREHLAEGLSCDGSLVGRDALFFQLEIQLTAQGLADLDTVIKRTFQAIHNISDHPIPEHVFQDVQKLALLRYQHASRKDAFEMMMKHGLQLSREEMATYPELTRTIKRADAKAVKELVSYLTPDKSQYVLTASDALTGVAFDKQEQWMGIHYTYKKIPEEKLKLYREAAPLSSIDFPKANPFVPQNLALSSSKWVEQKNYSSLPNPKTIADNDSMRAYFAQDTFYGTPRIFWRFTIKTPQIQNGKPQVIAMTDLYVKALEDLIDPISYDAKIAQLEFNVERKPEGIEITIEGFSDSAYRFLEQIASKLKITQLSPEKFAILKDVLTREYENAAKENPLRQAADLLKGAIYEHLVTNPKKLQGISGVDLDKFQNFLSKLFTKTYTEALLIGNLTEKDAIQAISLFQASLNSKPYPKTDQISVRVVEFPNNKGPFFIESKSEAQGNAALLAIEGAEYSIQNRNFQQILGQAIQEAFFSELRTKQQTGYSVFSNSEDLERHLFSFFGVQSNSHDPQELLYRFEQFIEVYVRNINEEIPLARFNLLKEWLHLKLTEPPKNLSEMGEKLYLLGFNYRNFDWTLERIAALKQQNYTDFVKFVEGYLGRNNRRRLGVLINGQTSKEHPFRYAPLNISKLRGISRFFKAA